LVDQLAEELHDLIQLRSVSRPDLAHSFTQLSQCLDVPALGNAQSLHQVTLWARTVAPKRWNCSAKH
jgi:hypothetical protein